ncbi:hypothetical protein C8A05DRAFT_36377 [Staphylotrichum tortipilum]|uniref:Uncharacterized protein n=1 Tax=Staphylotrichum tortipilum TaxID=2831512 RepID=A0AAN6MH40_9PEZI|nr:hypothetical protein C8A05DRAFT_36377 [Staphylotrichum longicolle]
MQQSECLEILRYFLNKGHPVDGTARTFVGHTGYDRDSKEFGPCHHSTNFDVPWGCGHICPPGWKPNWHMSPLEWVLRGGACGACHKQQNEPDPAALTIEQTLFTAMMEEGAEAPTSPDELQSALELVLHAQVNRAFRRRAPLQTLCETRVRYLVGKGARLEDLDAEFTKAAAQMARTWGADLAGRLNLSLEEDVRGRLKGRTQGGEEEAAAARGERGEGVVGSG